MTEHSAWSQLPWLGFDTETTGVNVTSDRLVTAALVLRPGGATPQGSDTVRTWLADPGVSIPDGAAAVHGITTEYAREHGAPIESVLEDVASALYDHMSQGYPVVAFNASYDFSLLEAELARHGLPTLSERLGSEPFPIIDPLVVDRALDRYRKGKRQLTTMAPVYGVEPSDQAHTAEYDVAMTLDVLAGIARRYPDTAAMTCEEFHLFHKNAHAAWAHNFEEYLRRKGQDAHISDRWPLL